MKKLIAIAALCLALSLPAVSLASSKDHSRFQNGKQVAASSGEAAAREPEDRIRPFGVELPYTKEEGASDEEPQAIEKIKQDGSRVVLEINGVNGGKAIYMPWWKALEFSQELRAAGKKAEEWEKDKRAEGARTEGGYINVFGVEVPTRKGT